MALEFLAYREKSDGGSHLQMIVEDMPRELSGIEVGFLSMLDFAAAAARPVLASSMRIGRSAGPKKTGEKPMRNAAYFDNEGRPVGRGWDEIAFQRSTTSMPMRWKSPAIR